MPAPLDSIALLYEHEIDCGLESEFDNGFICWIGNSYTGHIEESEPIRDFRQIAEWFDDAAKRALAEAVREGLIPQAYLDAYEHDSDLLFGRVRRAIA